MSEKRPDPPDFARMYRELDKLDPSWRDRVEKEAGSRPEKPDVPRSVWDNFAESGSATGEPPNNPESETYWRDFVGPKKGREPGQTWTDYVENSNPVADNDGTGARQDYAAMIDEERRKREEAEQKSKAENEAARAREAEARPRTGFNDPEPGHIAGPTGISHLQGSGFSTPEPSGDMFTKPPAGSPAAAATTGDMFTNPPPGSSAAASATSGDMFVNPPAGSAAMTDASNTGVGTQGSESLDVFSGGGSGVAPVGSAAMTDASSPGIGTQRTESLDVFSGGGSGVAPVGSDQGGIGVVNDASMTNSTGSVVSDEHLVGGDMGAPTGSIDFSANTAMQGDAHPIDASQGEIGQPDMAGMEDSTMADASIGVADSIDFSGPTDASFGVAEPDYSLDMSEGEAVTMESFEVNTWEDMSVLTAYAPEEIGQAAIPSAGSEPPVAVTAEVSLPKTTANAPPPSAPPPPPPPVP